MKWSRQRTETNPVWIRRGSWLGAVLAAWALAAPGVASAQCSPYLLSLPKGQALYLVFPTSDTTATVDGTTYDIGEFDVDDLDNSVGTTTQLRDRIFEIVRDSYCEFSVDVKKVTSVPAPAETRWQIIGIGSDSDASDLFGIAYGVDAGDDQPQDYASVWAGEFEEAYGGAGGPLDGANSTLERWATIIGGTVAHEGGHNYGLNHSDADPRATTSEDAVLNHILATTSDFGIGNFTQGDNRAKRIRHFSDTSFEILGWNIGLNTKTLSNWDFVNPNDEDATELRITVLSEADTLNITWAYNGTLSPWTNPTISKRAGTQDFQDQEDLNIFDVDFSTDKSWSGGADGVAPAGVKFHVGVGLSDDYIVWEVALSDDDGELDLQPRMFGYDAGTVGGDGDGGGGGDGDGDFDMAFFITDAARGDLLLENVQVLFLPRPVDIENMVVGGELLATDGLAVEPFPRLPRIVDDEFYETRPDRIPTQIKRLPVSQGSASLPLARLSDRRHVDITMDPTGCEPGILRGGVLTPLPDADDSIGEVIYCPEGPALSLFPATYVYVMATVVDPNAEYWDPVQAKFVTGRLESRLFYQFSGIVPDLNGNGVDDLLDIRDGTSSDDNGNGVVDEVERGQGRWAVNARLGLTFPDSLFLDSGLSARLGLEYLWRPDISWVFVLGYHEFDAPQIRGFDPSAVQLAINARYYTARRGTARFFVNGGPGAYFLDPGSTTEYGFNLGVGGDWQLRPGLELEAAANYHDIDSVFEFTTLQIGLRWTL